MTLYRITRTSGLPEGMKERGFAQVVTIEAGAASMPLPSEIEEKGGTAYFNGFAVELKKGDKVEQVNGSMSVNCE